MSKFFLIGISGKSNIIRKAVFGDLETHEQPDVRLCYVRKPKGLARAVCRVVTSRKLNRIVRMPLRYHWQINYRDIAPHLSETEENYVIFVPGEQMIEQCSPALLRALRKRRPDCKSVFYFVDSFERACGAMHVSEAYLLKFLKLFDFVATYSHEDAEKYGFRFIDIPVRHFDAPEKQSPAYSLHFSGWDKNRADRLAQIKQYVENSGVSTRFHVVPSPGSDLTRTDITYSKGKPYEEVVQDALKANCLLEVLATWNSAVTLRYKEAVIYNKKLLTTAQGIERLPYYDPRWMRVFQKPEDIDLDWLLREEDVDYGYQGDFTARRFLENVEKMCKGNG